MKTTQRTHIGRFFPAAVAVTVLALTACGPGTQATPGSTGEPAASPSASAASQPILVVAGPDVNATAPVITLYRPDGTEVNHFQLSQGSWPLAAAGDRIFIKSGDKLQAVKRDGSVETLVSPYTGQRFLVNADGTKWIWSTYTYSYSGDNFHSQVYLAGDGLQPRVIEDVTDAHSSLAPVSWTAQGVFIAHRPIGIGGYIPFDFAFGPVDRLDPTTWKAVPDSRTNSCAFSDEASDGTIACFPFGQGENPRQLALVRADGSRLTIPLPTPAFNSHGDAFFNPASSAVTVAGAVREPGNEEFTTDLVTKSDASLIPGSVSGVRPAMGPQSWLPDGSLVLWRPAHAVGGDPGLYVIDPAGHQTFIAVSGMPVGYLAS